MPDISKTMTDLTEEAAAIDMYSSQLYFEEMIDYDTGDRQAIF